MQQVTHAERVVLLAPRLAGYNKTLGRPFARVELP